MTRAYWFKDTAQEIARRLTASHGKWQIWGHNPVSQAWVRNTIAYFSTIMEASDWDTSLVYEGEQGELVKMSVPEARAMARQFLAMATKEKLAFNTVAQSRGADVVQETRLGNALAEQIVEEQDLDLLQGELAELAYVLGMAFTYTRWRTDKGIPYDSDDDGTIVYEGDVDISVVGPLDIFYDHTVPRWKDLDWVEVRTCKNRWDLIAQFPELEKEIRALPSTQDWRGQAKGGAVGAASEDDLVWCYEVYHRKTPSLPKGRMVMYADEKTVFFDGINRYDGIPIEPCIPEPVFGMLLGYPAFSNLLPAQEMLDHSFSAWATNQSAFAVQNVACPRGANVSVQNILGMNWISYSPQNVPGGGKPEAMQLTATSGETIKFIDVLENHMVKMSNVSGAMRGSLPPGVTSGTAIATLTTNAIEFMEPFSKALNVCLQKTVMHAMHCYRLFAETERLVRMVGKNFQSYSKEFVGSDLDPIVAVKLERSNPLLKTLAGRMEVGDKLIQMGAVKSTQDYMSVLEGAPVSTMYDVDLSENDLIEAENEAFLEGSQVLTLITDDHPRHIMKHKALLNDPAVRLHNQNVGTILEHIREHEQMAMDPANAALVAMANTGKMPQLPPPGPPGAPGGGMGAPAAPGEIEGDVAAPAEPAQDELGRAG